MPRVAWPDNCSMLGWIVSHPFAYPALEVVHIVGIALLLSALTEIDVRSVIVVDGRWR